MSTGKGIHAAGVALLIAAGAGAWALSTSRAHAESSERKARETEVSKGVPVLSTKAALAPPTRSVLLQGDVRPFRQATVYAKISGYLQSIRVDRGDRVKAGDVIGILESPETQQQELSARAALTLSERTEERVRGLVGKGVVSRQEFDNATGGLDVAKAEVARVGALRAYEVVRAPFEGRITARYVDEGALLPAATSATASAQPVVDVADLTKVRIFAYPGQLDAARINDGDEVALWTDADPAKKRKEKVTRITHALDPRTRTMLVEIDVDNTDEALRPGSYVHVKLTVPATGSISVPADAIVLRGGVPFVAVAQNGKAHYVPVEVADDDGKVVRLAKGVAAGDDVIVHPSDDVTEGVTVQLTPTTK